MSDRCQTSKKQSSDFVVQPEAGTRILLLFQITLVATLALYSTTGLAGDCDRVFMLENHERSADLPNDMICETFVGLTGTRGISCYWAFSYRSEDAGFLFRDAWREVSSCREGSSTSASKPLNHPDSYNLRELITERGTYRVALKDKGQQNRTLVVMVFENHK